MRIGEPPTPERLERWERRLSPPDNELPAGAGLTVLLGRTGEAAVGVTQFEVFSTGFRFTLSVRLRRAHPTLVRGGLHSLVSPRGGRPGFEAPVADRLLLGIAYADGRRTSTVHDPRTGGPHEIPDDEVLLLSPHSGSSSDLVADQGYWVSPLPPEGPVTFVLAWDSFGMPESQNIVDGAAIRAAADKATVLWPHQPPVEPEEPPPPPRPSTGWFADPTP